MIPDIVIGDFDSISSHEIKWITEKAVETRRFPPEKDQTDFELALDHAMKIGCKEIQVFGALGGRMDHTLANISLLSNPSYSNIDIWLIMGRTPFLHPRTSTDDLWENRGYRFAATMGRILSQV